MEQLSKEKAIEAIKLTRVSMDGQLTVIDQINAVKRTRETALALTALQLSRMWYGKALMVLGESGYVKDGRREDAKDIEPPTDTKDKVKDYTKDIEDNRTKVIDQLRQALRTTKKDLHASVHNQPVPAKVIDNASTYIEEAIMWLGAELGRIYKELK